MELNCSDIENMSTYTSIFETLISTVIVLVSVN